ncbi:glucose/galactose MFS transporter [Photobacterium sanctipauli]|uniref:Glucose/galactose MFS transporter n=2 Tax=Photobacterium sanctipauli TaxID=1342794 RepID=A0A2T3P0V6_9GAMM|nr:glucose/galactose MFS transporter [Photobacterium sanctipauli]PSW22155.1 glucose/galactose MFS transporter [Photobacterium sanctipauli]
MKTKSITALSLLSCVFFFWGFLTAINTVLVPYAKEAFGLSITQSMLIQTVFFSSPLLVCLPTVRLIRRVGYKLALLSGLGAISIGALSIIPALYIESFLALLGAILVIASGVAMLQVIANPYVVAIGPVESASQRLTFASSINSLGTTVGPYIGAYALFSSSSFELPTVMYLAVASAIILVALAIATMNMDEPKVNQQPIEEESAGNILAHRHLVFGIVAIFCYTGAETSIGSFLVSYLTNYAGYPQMAAAKMVTLYWGGAMIGRIIGSLIFGKLNPRKILASNTVLAILVTLTAMLKPGSASAIALVALGLLNSIMYPVIFSLALAKVGHLKERASGMLVMAGAGGAIVPLIQTYISETTNMAHSFLIPAGCYLFILIYSALLYRPKAKPEGNRQAISNLV